MEPPVRFELTTWRLQSVCSAIELGWQLSLALEVLASQSVCSAIELGWQLSLAIIELGWHEALNVGC